MYIPILRTTLLLVLFGTAPAAARAADGPSAVITEALALPPHLASYHETVRAAAAAVLETGGWRVIPSETSTCHEASCAPQLARELGAPYAVTVGGKYRAYGYDVELDLWDGKEATVKQATCENCTAPELVARVQDLLAPMIGAENTKRATATAAAAATSRAPASRAPEPAVVVPVQPAPPASPNLLAPALVGAGGLGLVAGGVALWVLDGRTSTHCTAGGGPAPNCDLYKTRSAGEVLTGVGVATLVVAGVLGYRALNHARVQVSIGPAGVAMGGRF